MRWRLLSAGRVQTEIPCETASRSLRRTIFASETVPGFIQICVSTADEEQGDEKGQKIGHRHGEQHAIQTKKDGEQQSESYTKYYFADHGQGGGFHRLSHSLQKDEARFVDAGQDDEAQVNAKSFDGKAGIIGAFMGGAKN